MKHEPTDFPEELLTLLGELAEGSLSPQGHEQLSQMLATDPEALRCYCRWMHLQALLSLDLGHSSSLQSMPPLMSGPAARQGRPKSSPGSHAGPRAATWARRTAAAVLAASLAFAAVLWVATEYGHVAQRPAELPQGVASELFDYFDRTRRDSVAVLSSVADAVGPGEASLIVGSPVPSGRFVLESGLVQLEFLCGANIVVEGPAELDLVSTTLVVCHRGKLRARVPEQASGFCIETPHHRAVDLGTEFAVSVGDGDSTEVHVFEGEVELYDRADLGQVLDPTWKESAWKESLKIGAGFRASEPGKGERIAADSSKFIDVQGMLSRSSQDSQARHAEWREYSARWQSDPHVVAFYNFDAHDRVARVLRHDGPSDARSLNGAIVGCRWTEGRWAGKAALEFKGIADRVRINVPGEFQSITLACWIRIDGFDRRLGSIFLTDGHDIGEPHWQFTNTGQLLLGVEAAPSQSQEYLTDSVLSPTDLGRWLHLACVYDQQRGEVSHYIDGKRVATLPIINPVPLRIGSGEMGNWVPENLVNDRIRSLNGRIDEFLLLDRAMTDDEVREMHIAGRPNS